MTEQGEKNFIAAMVFDPVGPLAILSNFAEFPVHGMGRVWRSAEHLFQASKFREPEIISLIAAAEDAAAAKAIGWNHVGAVLADWPAARDDAMREVLRAKFSEGSAAASFLVATWPLPILEDSMTDNYWGIGADGRGANRLGELLCEIRARLLGRGQRDPRPLFKSRPAHHLSSRYAAVSADVNFLASIDRPEPIALLGKSPLATGSIVSLLVEALGARGIEVPPRMESCETLDAAAELLQSANPALTRQSITDILIGARAQAFDSKYANYGWNEDARSLFPGWCREFFGALENEFVDLSSGKCLVVGGGSGDEAGRLWAPLGSAVTFVELGAQLLGNCKRAAPEAAHVQAAAEQLDIFANESFNAYVALRTFESAFLDVPKAVAHMVRVLRRGGTAVVSISNAYKTSRGEFVEGQIVGSQISIVAAPRMTANICSCIMAAGMTDPTILKLSTEWLLIARKP